MSSSPIPAARCQYLLDLLAQVPDPRRRRGRRHRLAGLLAVGIAAVLAGSRSFAAIGQWAADAGPRPWRCWARHGPAEESTFRRAFALVSAGVLDRVLGAWLWTRAVQADGRLVIAIDGKTVRGARTRPGRPRTWSRPSRTGSGPSSARSPWTRNRMRSPRCGSCRRRSPTWPGRSSRSTRCTRKHDTAQAVLSRDAGSVMTVKATVPTLYRQLKKLPWTAVPAVPAVSTDHGRRARRTIKAVLAPAWIGFPGAAQVAQLRRTVTRNGRKTVEVVYLITSDRDADPATLAAWVRGHREIENCLHRASQTLRRCMTLRPRCGYGRRACWAWRQRLSC